MAGLVDVTVKVPEGRLGEFHLMYGEWLNQTGPRNDEVQKALEWSSHDKDLARGMHAALPAKAQRLVTILSKEGETDERSLIARLGVTDSSQFNGINGWVGRIAFAFGRKTPTKWTTGADGTRVWYIEPKVAGLFKELEV
jgi:hypothetical protein